MRAILPVLAAASLVCLSCIARRDVWPHGATGEAFEHAALFRR